MNLVVQGAGMKSADATHLAAISGAKTLEQIAELAWRLSDASPSDEVTGYCERRSLDHAWVPAGRQFAGLGLMAMDMDSTLITIECIDEIGAFVGKKSEIAAITEQAMRGEDLAIQAGHAKTPVRGHPDLPSRYRVGRTDKDDRDRALTRLSCDRVGNLRDRCDGGVIERV